MKLNDFDITKYLDSPEAIAEYLDQVLAGGDPAEIRRAIAHVAKAQGMTDIALKSGVTRAGLYKALDENGNPSFALMGNVLKALGVRLSVTA